VPFTSEGKQAIAEYPEIVKEIKNSRQWTNEDNLPICIVPGAPAPGDYWQIDQLRESGVKYLSINLEVGNPDMFKVICPGKAKNGGYENWLGALEYAVKIFGKWNVRSNFVPGIEPMQDTLKVYQYLAEKGIWTHFFQPWFPDAGSLLEGHRSPSGEWYFELANRLADIWEQVNAPIEQLNLFPGANDSIAFDVWRTRQGRKIPEFYRLLKKETT
jgi:biotin synthase-related radical SAM superfamily protein